MAKRTLYRPQLSELVRYVGERDGALLWLEHLTPNIFHRRYDFEGDLFPGGAAPGIFQSTASGTGAAAAAISAGLLNGAILLDAGSDDNGRTDLSLGLHMRGSLNAVVAVRLQLSAITAVKCEVGFTDVISGTDAGAVNVLATPSFNATDACVWVIDTDDTATWQGAGVDTGTAATKMEEGGIAAPVAATYQTLIVALRDYDTTNNITAAKFIQADDDEDIVFESAWMTAAITSNISLTPWVFVQNRSAVQRTCTVDYVEIWQRRTANA